jgi:hypothetical protein
LTFRSCSLHACRHANDILCMHAGISCMQIAHADITQFQITDTACKVAICRSHVACRSGICHTLQGNCCRYQHHVLCQLKYQERAQHNLLFASAKAPCEEALGVLTPRLSVMQSLSVLVATDHDRCHRNAELDVSRHLMSPTARWGCLAVGGPCMECHQWHCLLLHVGAVLL